MAKLHPIQFPKEVLPTPALEQQPPQENTAKEKKSRL